MRVGTRNAMWMLAAGMAGIALVLLFGRKPVTPIQISTTQTSPPVVEPATQTQTAPASTTISDYGQLLHAELPHYPATKPWDIPLDLADAAHIVLKERVYVCPRGDLWIARSDGKPLADALAGAQDQSEHICDEAVKYVLWTIDPKGEFIARAVCAGANGDVLVSATERTPLPPHVYHWAGAINWNDNGQTRLIVPTDDGVSCLTVSDKIEDSFIPLGASPGSPQVALDLRGVLAWIPADDHAHPDSIVARFVDGKWSKLDSTDWPGNIIQLIVMLDGTVMQIRRTDGQTVAMTFVPLDSPAINEQEVTPLVTQLGDDDPDKRTAAFGKLTQYGRGIFPILDKLRPNSTPEAQARIDQLMEEKLATLLGGKSITDNLLTVKTRLADGGVIFYAPDGDSTPNGQLEPTVLLSDYIALRDGSIQSLPETIVHELDATVQVIAYRDEWVVTRSDRGPERYLPPGQLIPLLRESEGQFRRLTAIDRNGRWIFCPRDSVSPTLILDPTVPDPTPRLAVWSIDTGDSVGWTPTDWPVVVRGKNRWMLSDHDWQLMKETDPVKTTWPAPAANAPILVDEQKNQYWNGVTELDLTDALGHRHTRPLPKSCLGSHSTTPWLIRTDDGSLFLLNDPDRVTRLSPGAGAEPFSIDAIFTKNLPALRDIQRVWLDPFGRIIVAYGRNRLAVIYPNGQIPKSMSDLILTNDLRRVDPQ